MKYKENTNFLVKIRNYIAENPNLYHDVICYATRGYEMYLNKKNEELDRLIKQWDYKGEKK